MIDFAACVAPGISELQPYVPGKPIEELERELGLSHTLKLASNENPLGASPLAIEAAQHVIESVHRYPDDTGHRLKQKLAHRHGVQMEQIVLGAGSSDVIDMVARSFLAPGRNAVFSQYGFAMYPIYTTAAGATCKVAPALPPDHARMPYGHDLDAMLRLVDEETRVVFIANPNNPTGTWLESDELLAFLHALPEHLVVVLDEAYSEYVEQSAFPNGVAWIERFPNLLVTHTFSKIYGLAGLRVGYGVAQRDLIEWIGRVRHPFNVNSAALAAAQAALDDQEFVARSRALNRAGLAQLRHGLEEMGLRCMPSIGNFISVDLRKPADAVYRSLLKKGVIVRPVANYGLPEHIRISVGTEQENLRCLQALNEVLNP